MKLFIQRGPSERLIFERAMQRYLAEVTPTKRPLTQSGELKRSVPLIEFFGKYSLVAVTAELVAQYQDKHLAGEDRKGEEGEPIYPAGSKYYPS